MGSNPTLTAKFFFPRVRGRLKASANQPPPVARLMILARLLPLVALSLVVAGCVSTPEDGEAAKKPDREGLIGKVGNWLAEDPADPKSRKDDAKDPATPPLTQQLPIGSVHLVHEEAKFLLIRSSRTTSVAPEAELLTYDAGGRPTGKLKLSPERKSGFLTADIVEGRPQTGDRVVMFGHSPGPVAPVGEVGVSGEVLE